MSRLGSHPQAFFSFRGAELVLRLNALPTPTILAQVGLYSGMLTLIVKPFLFSGWSKCVENDSLNLFFFLSSAISAGKKYSHLSCMSSCVYSGLPFPSLLYLSIFFNLPFVFILEVSSSCFPFCLLLQVYSFLCVLLTF